MKVGQLAFLAVAGMAVASCAQPPQEPVTLPAGTPMAQYECFRTRDMEGHTIGDDRSLFIDVRGKGVYRVSMRGACLAGAVSSDPLVIEQPPGNALVCRPMDFDVRISKGGGPAIPCIVETITRLSDTEVASLPPKLRP